MAAKLLYRDAQGRDASVDLLPEGAFLGRAVDCVVRTDDAMVSRKNCKISVLGGRWFVEDLGSANGTFVNNQRVHAGTLLKAGDELRMDTVRFLLMSPGMDAPAATVRTEIPAPAAQAKSGSALWIVAGLVVLGVVVLGVLRYLGKI